MTKKRCYKPEYKPTTQEIEAAKMEIQATWNASIRRVRLGKAAHGHDELFLRISTAKRRNSWYMI